MSHKNVVITIQLFEGEAQRKQICFDSRTGKITQSEGDLFPSDLKFVTDVIEAAKARQVWQRPNPEKKANIAAKDSNAT